MHTTTRSLRLLPAALLLAVLTVPAHAGLRFTQVAALEGADTPALAADGATLWAGTVRGVWRLESGTWNPDGLSGKSVSSLAVFGGTVWAATGDGLWRRGADGSWSPEPLPGGPSIVNAVYTNGSSLYAAGLGVFVRSGNSWTALSGAGGVVISLVTHQGDLVAGVAGQGAVRYPGGTGVPVAMSSGLGPSEGIQAFAVWSGVLFAGTSRGVYSWSGASWAPDSGYGVHDVRSLATASGWLWAASVDAGISRKSGGSWSPANGGLLVASAKSLTALASDLYAGTAGAPIYRYSGASWSPAGNGLFAASVSDIAYSTSLVHSVPLTAAASRGGGIAQFSPPPASGLDLPPGCGDIRAAIGLGNSSYLAATNCGPYTVLPVGTFEPRPADEGLPAGAVITSLTGFPDIVAGTANAGIWRYAAGSWSPDNEGLGPTASISTVRQVGDDLFAAPGLGVARRGTDGTWHDESAGLPFGSSVQAFGGPGAPSGPVFSGLLPGGIYRKDPSSTVWQLDSAGIGNAPVYSIDHARTHLLAAAGSSGLFRKTAGAWSPEWTGFPAGADVRVVRRDWYQGVDRILAGTAGNGLFVADAAASTTTIPVVLDVQGTGGARFRTELTLGNRGAAPLDVTLSFLAASGFGAPAAGSATVTLAGGTEIRAADALAYLRGLGIPVPPAGPATPVAGSLSMSAAAGTDLLYGEARSYTDGAFGGTYGLILPATSDLDAAEEEAFVYGLRSVSGVARSNLAVTSVPGRGIEPVAIEVQLFDAAGAPAPTLLTKSLAPGEWYQWNGVLAKAGLPDGSFGYARIRRVAGSAAFVAYGVVNDALTSDGSVLPMVRPGGVSAARKLIVPAVVDTRGEAGSHFTTELTLVNDGPIPTPVDLVYRPAPGFGSATGAPVVTVSLAARQQATIPDTLQFLRDRGVNIPDSATGGPQAGTLAVTFRALLNLEGPRTLAFARTSTPNPDTATGGSFGVAYPAIPAGGGSRGPATVPGLTQDVTVRSNLAVVHAGGGSDGPIGLSVQLHDAATGAPAGHPLAVTLNPGDWYQWSRVLEKAGAVPGTTKARAVVTRVSGDDTFFAYGVLNDAVTSDGSFLAMIPDTEY